MGNFVIILYAIISIVATDKLTIVLWLMKNMNKNEPNIIQCPLNYGICYF